MAPSRENGAIGDLPLPSPLPGQLREHDARRATCTRTWAHRPLRLGPAFSGRHALAPVRCSDRHLGFWSASVLRGLARGGSTRPKRRSDVDADRKAWHRAQATAVPDEDVAAALQQTAARAKGGGGLAAAGAFLERGAELTPDVGRRVERALDLRHVYPKLGITSRRELWTAFAADTASGEPAS
jgi:hypothetical protein